MIEVNLNDTRPIDVTLTHGSNPAPLSGAIAFVATQRDGINIVSGSGSIVDGDAGQARYEPAAGDFDVEGAYDMRWVVTYTGGAVESFPAEGPDLILVGASIEANALRNLSRMVAAEEDPYLSDFEVSELLLGAQTVDLDGVSPADGAWVPTWDLKYAAAAGWDLKSAYCANRFRFRAEEQQTFDRQQIFEHCQAMAKRYRRYATPVG